MNPGAPGWREYFAEKAADNRWSAGFGGLFLDNLDLSLQRAHWSAANSNGGVREYASDAEYREATVGFLAGLRRGLPDTTIWANLTGGDDSEADWDAYLPYLDGVMNEYFVARWSGTYADDGAWERQLRQAEAAIGRWKAFLAVAQGPAWDAERMRFALASYLLVAGERDSYFRYADAADYDESWQYDDYGARLGSPLGGRYLAEDGSWQRDFACGQVSIDPTARRASIRNEPSRASCTP